MKLKEFMAEHFEDYITLEHKDHLVYDIFIKFVPYWVLHTSNCTKTSRTISTSGGMLRLSHKNRIKSTKH